MCHTPVENKSIVMLGLILIAIRGLCGACDHCSDGSSVFYSQLDIDPFQMLLNGAAADA